MPRALYQITLTNWIEHNPGKKNTYKKTLIANNLISDAKILALPLSHRWLFINLLLICGDYASETITLNEQQLNDILTARVGCENALNLLQSLQLLTFEKTPLKEEKERKEVKKEKKGREQKLPTEVEADVSSEILSFWNSFENLPRALRLNPNRKAKVRSRLQNEEFKIRWKEAITLISQSLFLTGVNDRGWKADFGWFIENDDNYLKVLEGKYQSNQTNKKSHADRVFDHAREQLRQIEAGEL